VLAAEEMLVKVIERAKEISATRKLDATPSLSYFLENSFSKIDFETKEEILKRFADLDDTDVISSIKMWRKDEDPILSWLSKHLLERKLFHIELRNTSFSEAEIIPVRTRFQQLSNMPDKDLGYFVFTESTSNHAYSPQSGPINILFKDGSIKDIADASDLLNIRVLEAPVVKYYLCYPKEIL